MTAEVLNIEDASSQEGPQEANSFQYEVHAALSRQQHHSEETG